LAVLVSPSGKGRDVTRHIILVSALEAAQIWVLTFTQWRSSRIVASASVTGQQYLPVLPQRNVLARNSLRAI